jgi:hypothetical protein
MLRRVEFFEDDPEFIKVLDVNYVFFDDGNPSEIVRIRQRIFDELLRGRGKLQVAVWKPPLVPVTQKPLRVIGDLV